MRKAAVALIFAVIVSGAHGAPVAVAAEEKEPAARTASFSFTPTAGAYFSSNNDLTAGVKLGYETDFKSPADSLGFEATFSYLAAMPGSDTNNGYLFRLDATHPIVAGKKYVPFLAFGGGISAQNNGRVTHTSPLINYGMGLKYLFKDNMALRADVRHILLDTGSDNYEVTFGVSYAFEIEIRKKPVIVPDRAEKTAAEAVTRENAAVPDAASGKTGRPGDKAESAEATPAKPEAPVPEPTRKALPVPEAARPDARKEQAAPLVEELLAADNEPSIKLLRDSGVRVETFVIIEFASGASTPDAASCGQLEKIALLVKSNPALRIWIAGHTDNAGNPHANYLLSLKRAQRAKNFLVKKLGIVPQRIVAIGYGHYQPVADNATPEGRRKNRRAVTIVLAT